MKLCHKGLPEGIKLLVFDQLRQDLYIGWTLFEISRPFKATWQRSIGLI